MTTFILQLALVLAQWGMIWQSHHVTYNKLINPIIIFCPFLITQWIVIRIGPLTGYFMPNALQNGDIIKTYFTNAQYVNFLGTVPEILWIVEIAIGALVDAIYWCFLDKRRRMLIH